jgi:hypothetical protein
MMSRPPATDNFTLWYSPTLTSDAKFYEKIIFGYEGAGRARYDLTDPDDGLPGINLAGFTDGNITLTSDTMCAIFVFAKGRCPDERKRTRHNPPYSPWQQASTRKGGKCY